ncbi:MAG: hypothetical protein IIU15_06580 [Treponema sp.]|nr:hypothetical protein [Treponema sp.]
MNRQIFSIIVWTVFATLSIVCFTFLKIRTFGEGTATVEERWTEKIDSAILPETVGENTLPQNFYCIAEDSYSLSLDFLDEKHLLLGESFSFDGYFVLNLKWAAEYSVDSEKCELYIKRKSLLDGCEEISSSLAICDRMTEAIKEKILVEMDSVSLKGEGLLRDILFDRVYRYVDSVLFEIKTFEIVREGNGVLVEATKDFSSKLTFTSTNFEGSISVKDNVIFILAETDAGERKFGGVLFDNGQNLSATLYEFERPKGSRDASLTETGKMSVTIEEGSTVSDSQTVECKMKIVDAPKDFLIAPGTVFSAQKILCPGLMWMITPEDKTD